MKKKYNFRFIKTIAACLFSVVLTVVAYWSIKEELFYSPDKATVYLDKEHLLNGVPLNSGTQSINRYSSKLRELDKVDLQFNPDAMRVTVVMQSSALAGDPNSFSSEKKVVLRGIDSRYLTPLLPYVRDNDKLSEFDKFNLMLAEYARNGVSLSRQKDNKYFGSFYSTEDFFDKESKEYLYFQGKISPNEAVAPKRLSIINNCLTPGLWEISAGDSVGEMYHGWFTLPRDKYFSMLRENNNLSVTDWDLRQALRYKKSIQVELNLNRLRKKVNDLFSSQVSLSKDTLIGGYSTQDSRRKVQRKFFRINRGGEKIHASTLGDLRAGDVFRLYSFVPPGVYTPKKFTEVPFNSDLAYADFKEVIPLTKYDGNQSKYDNLGYIEVTLYSSSRDRAFVVGNIPVSLLVFQDDFDIPAFGVGVLSSSEAIERRFLRLREGPSPYYAYMAILKDNKLYGINNHEAGIEQIYLRPFQRDGQTLLRVSLVSYERITDILEVEVALNKEMSERIKEASQQYQRPLYRTYSDSNVL